MDVEKQRHTQPMDEEKVSVEDLQVKVDRLQELVCHLLIKNEKIRMASPESKANVYFDGLMWTPRSAIRSGTLRTSPNQTDEKPIS